MQTGGGALVLGLKASSDSSPDEGAEDEAEEERVKPAFGGGVLILLRFDRRLDLRDTLVCHVD